MPSNSKPLMPGISASSKMRSGANSRAKRIASLPLVAKRRVATFPRMAPHELNGARVIVHEQNVLRGFLGECAPFHKMAIQQ